MRARCGVPAVLAAVALVASACGSRLPDNVLARIDAGSVRGPAASATLPGASDAAPTVGDVTNPADPSGALGSGAVTAVTGRTAGAGPQTATGPAPNARAAALCTAGTAPERGVRPSEIHVASMVTDSGPLPGATEGAYRGAAAYFAMINAQGGICGHKLTIEKGDDGLDPQRGRSEFERLEPKVLAFVGNLAVADSGYLDLIQKSGVPYIGTTVDPAGRVYRNVVPRIADGVINTGPFVWWKQQHPDVTNTALLYSDVGGVKVNVPGFRAAILRAGFDIKYDHPTNITAPDYTAEVVTMEQNNVDFLYLFAFEVNMHIRLVRNMRQQNYEPKIRGANIAYNTRFSDLLGTEGDGWENHITYLPFLDPSEAQRSAGLASYLQWNNRVFHGAQLDLFPEGGWTSAAYFVQALRLVKGDITRSKLVDALYQIHSINGDGLQVTVDPATGDGDRCFIIAKHVGGHWKRSWPPAGYECGVGEIYRWK